MAGVEHRDFSAPDETRSPDKTTVELVNLAGGQIGRYTFHPGWKWSECIKPIAGTDSCMVHHNGYVVSGSLHIVMDDGTEHDINAGDVFVCPPGHDAWVTSDEACIAYDFSPDAARYAKPQ